jgi:hypothetical protein
MPELSLDTFSPHVGTTFQLQLEGATLDLTLAEATEPEGLGPRPHGIRTPYSLSFSGPPQPVLPQRIYTLAHPSVGTIEIFLVPIAADSKNATYEAVFA